MNDVKQSKLARLPLGTSNAAPGGIVPYTASPGLNFIQSAGTETTNPAKSNLRDGIASDNEMWRHGGQNGGGTDPTVCFSIAIRDKV